MLVFKELILSESGNVVLSKLLPGPQLSQDDSDSQVSTWEPGASQPWSEYPQVKGTVTAEGTFESGSILSIQVRL